MMNSTAQPETIFGRLAVRVLRRRRATAWSVVAAIALSVGLALTLRINPNIWFLLPENDRTVLALEELEAVGGRLSLVTLTLKGEPEDTRAWFQEVEKRFAGDERIRSMLYEMPSDLSWHLGLLQVPPKDLEALADRLKGALILGPAVANPFVAASLLDLGPMTKRLKENTSEFAFLPTEGFARMILRPSESPQNLPFTRSLMKDLESVMDELAQEDREVEVLWVGGPYHHTNDDYEGVVHDMKWTGLLAFLLIFTLLSVAFRDAWVLLLVFVPLLVGCGLTFGYAAIVVKELNTFTSFFGTVLFGLGVDFSIHLYTRYREERAQSSTLEEAVVRAWDKVGPPCLAAAATTSVGFASMMAAHFRGFAELGLLLASGVLICLVSVLVVLPLLIYWREKTPVPYPRKPRLPKGGAPPTYRFAPLVLLLLVLGSGFAAIGVTNLETEYDISELRRDGQSWEDLDAERKELARQSFAPVVLSYDDAEAMAAAHDSLGELARSGGFSGVSDVLSVHSLIPRDQAPRLEILREIAAMTGHESYGYLPPAVRQNLAPLADASLSPLTASDLPQGLQDLLGAGSEKHHLMLLARGNLWDLRQSSDLLASVEAQVGDTPAAGQYMVLGSLYRILSRDAPVISLLSFLLVCFGTLLHLRRPVQAAGAVGVLLAGMLWAGAAAATLDIRISMVNVVGISILLGIGVDVVIHLLHRIREEGPGRMLNALASTGWAAALSSTTTVLSFAALSLASQRGIQSLGLLVLVGLTAVTLCAFSLLPVGWMAAWKIGGEMPYEEDGPT